MRSAGRIVEIAALLPASVRQDSLILGNEGVKKTRTYNEDELKGYVLILQKFDRLIKEGVKDGTIIVTENPLETDKTFDL